MGLMQQTGSSTGLASTPTTSNADDPPDTPSGITSQIPREDKIPEVAPSPSDYGSVRIRHSGVSYISSSHWAAVLDDIAELRDHIEQDNELHEMVTYYDHNSSSLPSPQLFYSGGCTHISVDSILESIPPRPVVDRLISRYFNELDLSSGVPHTGKFLREYEEFWKSPHDAPIVWIGLLLSMMCLSTQVQNLSLDKSTTTTAPDQIKIFREQITQCLLLGHYTEGGPHVLETLTLYLMTEVFPSKDTAPGLRILASTIVTIATQMGYHRDAKHFPNITPFAAEMRRRTWAVIVQIDFNISMQMGLARIIKSTQTDVAEPRNLLDSDFDENTPILPPSRPESEITPTLYTLAKTRLIVVGAQIADVATEPGMCSYARVLELDGLVAEYRAALPASMKWDGLESSLSVPAQVLIKRIWLEAREKERKYPYSRSTCVEAAMKILELQHLVDEETRVDGRLYQTRWRVTASFIHDFLLATSLLCFYLQSQPVMEQEESSGVEVDDYAWTGRIKQLLRLSQVIWLRESHSSQEARKAASALHYVLGDQGESGHPKPNLTGHVYGPDMMPAEFMKLDFAFVEEIFRPERVLPEPLDDEAWDGDWQQMQV
ncbi:Fungal-specific transcription factor protein [Penicillium verhagenii]|uniref:Fungal-specific transcription factor protein n=1 Tax=Penicillium verhagenii TaxID=1562060 RepID=UPI002545A9B1|nr:Fungal-specific transcription factor protein [Penicillium verhagenii]XP_057016384.1 Fungal-specific transcription factor protein [Penicillium verhagenii]KAJ5915737.1 Fungal-specific transcription factor protein [Penicillium verhagenii]KAJ5917709.1 Fungal-specific transcription factor protein [Penicillium verhagenii]